MVIYEINDELIVKKDGDDLFLYYVNIKVENGKYVNNTIGTDYEVFRMLSRFLESNVSYKKRGYCTETLRENLPIFKLLHCNEDNYNKMLVFFNI